MTGRKTAHSSAKFRTSG